MIFEIKPSQIINLDSVMLVELLRKLLHAEANKSGVELRSVSVPLQITTADGGEDARVNWKGGHEKTNYFPSRFSIFQSKATDPQPSGWKKEVWTKSSQKDGVPRVLNDALLNAIANKGSYVGFTSKPIVGSKYDRRIKAIKDGIIEAGADPNKLKVIDIYDANKIAAWVTSHPALAIWLNEQESGLKLASFQTVEGWGRKVEISSIKYVEDKASRFHFNLNTPIEDDFQNGIDNTRLTSRQAKERVHDHLKETRKCIRIIGPSGVGKSRFVYECLSENKTVSEESLGSSVIFCDSRTIGNQIFETAMALAQDGANTLLVVDECSREDAIRLGDIITTEGSNLQIITIGLDDRAIVNKSCLSLSLRAGDGELIEGIILQRYPEANPSEVSYIRNLCGGFPRIAVLATDNYSAGAPILRSIEDVVERVLKSSNILDDERVRAIECLSLFEKVGCDEIVSEQIDLVANALARQSGDQMFEYLAEETKHNLVDRRGLYFYAQPIPIATYLGQRRLDLIRVKTILEFIEQVSEELCVSFLNQWRNFDNSRNAVLVADKLLNKEGKFGRIESIDSEFGSRCFDALVHVVPDSAADMLSRELLEIPITKLVSFEKGRSNLVAALEKLVFRNQSFPTAARVLLRLAAAENQTWSNNSTGAFCQLFNLELSGSEVEPIEKFAIIDQAIEQNEDEKIIVVCINALAFTLNRHHFTRTAGSEQIGNRPPLLDWHARYEDEITAFHSSGLKRLNDIRYKYPQYASKCEEIISGHIRTLTYEEFFPQLKLIVQQIANEKGLWLEAIKSLGDWLYFDRKRSLGTFSDQVKCFYDDLLPKDLIGLALLYTKFWSTHIRNPDVDYIPNNADDDFDFAIKKGKEIAILISRDKTLSVKCLDILVEEELHNSYSFAYELALNLENSTEIFKHVIGRVDKSKTTVWLGIVQGLLGGIHQKNIEEGEKCFQIALASEKLKPFRIQLYTALEISKAKLNSIIKELQNQELNVRQCVSISYGQRLNKLTTEDIIPFIDELTTNHGGEGMWTALEILQMYKYGGKDLDINLAVKIKEIVSDDKLFTDIGENSIDAHVLETLINLVSEKYGLDESFALKLSHQLTRICKIQAYGVFHSLRHCGYDVIKLLIQKQPLVIWKVFSEFFETCSPAEANRLQKLVSPQLNGLQQDDKDKAGALYGLPIQTYIDWAMTAPATRAPFLSTFFPFIEIDLSGKYTFNPEFITLISEFGAVPEFQRAILHRMYPTTWSGSLSDILVKYIEPIRALNTHSIIDIKLWAKNTERTLSKSIKNERKHEEETMF